MRRLVVGVDGSPGSLAALAWAARVAPEAALDAVHVWPSTVEVLAAAAPRDRELQRRAASDHLRGAWTSGVRQQVRALHCEVLDGDPAVELTALAERLDADAIVVGRHGHGAHGGPGAHTVGHLTAALVRRATRPVVVVPGAGVEPVARGAHIVVGIGHGPSGRVALRWAAALARDRGLGLSLVHAVGLPSMVRAEGLAELLAYTIDPAALGEWAEEDLAELAAEVRDAADVPLPVTWRTSSGRAGPRLVDAAAGAALLVVGVHRGSVADLAAVPTLHHVLTHAPCPVAVVPALDAA